MDEHGARERKTAEKGVLAINVKWANRGKTQGRKMHKRRVKFSGVGKDGERSHGKGGPWARVGERSPFMGSIKYYRELFQNGLSGELDTSNIKGVRKKNWGGGRRL